MSFHLDENNDVICDGYKRADSGIFSKQELSEAYVMASRPTIAENFPGDDQLLESYLMHKPVEGKRQVFNAWREGLEYEVEEEGPTLVDRMELPDFEDPASAFAGFTTEPGTNRRHVVFRKGDKVRHEEDNNGQAKAIPSYPPEHLNHPQHENFKFEQFNSSEEAEKSRYSKPMGSPSGLNPEVQTSDEPLQAFGKYKPVALKVRPVKADLPEEYRVQRNITGDALADMPELSTHPPEFTPTGRYTQERKEIIDANHAEDFLWEEERKLVHHLMMIQEKAFAWTAEEAGTFRQDFFPPVKIPVLPHEPWVERNIPVPPGIFEDVCKIIKEKIDAGVYEPSSSSYRSKWFCVVKKDGKSLRLVHSLEPLNKVTIQHSGIPPATAEVARDFCSRACGATFDLYVGYDERPLAVSSRDLTTFQTPYGPHRLVKLPMGWTNSVPIFHDDVTYILKEEIPHVTIPYVDDVPIKGPKTRYELPDGGYETIPENKGIRRFVWEHMQNVNRVLQRMKYAGGTFSGKKSFVCNSETMVVGHRCTYAGRLPEDRIADSVLTWPECKDKSDIRAFLGTAGQLRMFIENYAKKAMPLTKLTSDMDWEWGDEQRKAMDELKEGIRKAPALRNINYEWDVSLAVDTSYKAVGWFIYQIDPSDPKKKYFNYFGSTTLNEREARFSQSKRELYGLKLALHSSYYLVYGSRKMTVETDASYIKGMLDHPSCGPNATINHWIEEIRKFHFKILHVKGILHGPDGLSRRAPGGYQSPRHPNNSDDYEDHDDGAPIELIMGEGTEKPLDFETFRDNIDPRSGYLNYVTNCPEDSMNKRVESLDKDGVCQLERELRGQDLFDVVSSFHQSIKIPEDSEEWRAENPYPVHRRSEHGNKFDDLLQKIIEWHTNPEADVTSGMSKSETRSFIRQCKRFFLDKAGRLYWKASIEDGQHQLVVKPERRMFLMHSAHDSLAHKGTFATREFLEKRFWWPEMEGDVHWYVGTCVPCQNRQLRLLKIPPVVTHTPSLFQKVHVDTIHISPASNGCKYIAHARDSLSSWPEARALPQENTRALGEWFFDDIICRWGCPEEVVTDNAPVMIAMVAWLGHKYGIRGIRVSPYNSQGNGKIERAHFDIRQALVKATGGDIKKWFYFLKPVLWAERVTAKRGFGCSPYFLATGAEPLLPFDIVESTWLVNPPDRILTHEELVGYRAQALSKHRTFVADMRKRVSETKRKDLREFEKKYRNVIFDYDFKPGTLVQVRNTSIEKSLDRKMYPRYLGPLVVIRRTRGGSYIVAEMDGTVWKSKVGAFRVLPHRSRYEPIELPQNIHDLIDLSKEQLDSMVNGGDDDDEVQHIREGGDPMFDRIPNLRITEDGNEEDNNSEESDSDEESGDGKDDDSHVDNASHVRTRAMRR